MNAEEIFHDALARPPAERPVFLSAACAGDETLQRRVEALLHAHENPGSFLAKQPATPPATLDEPMRERPGTVIGPYKLLQQIGEGGMGTVFMAEQTEPVQRKVALKVIKPGMDSRQVIARFEAERQALAVMDHVNIARVFDGGATENGRPYFVMELVHGVPITSYCDDNHLTPRERLELFVPVCQAIQHAHLKGMIHRDIKPSNIMVTLYDGKPVPKVIDFGVAKATEQKLTERTLFTQYGTMVGTLEYMSPEQAEMSALGVDTRSDIYSLGVLLYELLTGSTPLSHKRLKEAAYAEILRMIKEEEPPKPSARLSDSGEALASISANRHTEPAKLTKLLKGELDWIVMKTLEKDRNRRYETANGLAQDVQNYLADEPVQACPPAATYRFGKFARRNRVALTTVTLIALALVLGTVVSIWQAIRADTARTAEAEQRRVAEAERSEAQKQRNLAEENFQRARKAVDEYFTLVSESKLLHVPGMQPLRKELLEAALRYYQAMRSREASARAVALQKNLIAQFPNVPAYRAMVAAKLTELASDLAENRPQEAEKNHREALQAWQNLSADFPAAHEYAMGLANAQSKFAKFLAGRLKRREEGLQIYREAVEQLTKLIAEPPKELGYRLELVYTRRELAVLQSGFKDGLGDAEKLHLQSLAELNELIKEFPKEFQYVEHTGHSYRYLGGIARDTGRPAEAIAYFENGIAAFQKLAEADIPQKVGFYRDYQADTLKQLALVLAAGGRPNDAEKAIQRGVETYESLVRDYAENADYRRKLASALRVLAELFAQQKKLPEASAEAQKAVRLAPNEFAIHEFLLDMLTRIGNKEQTLDILRGNVAAMPDCAMAHHHLAVALERQGRNDEAIAEFQKTIELHPDWEWPHQCIANIDAALGQWDKASSEYTKAIKLNSDRWNGWSGRAFAYFHLQQWDKAVSDFSRAIGLAPQMHTNWFHRGHAYLNLAQWDKARVDFAKVVDQWPNDPKGWYYRGVAYAQLNQPDKALADLHQAIAKGFKGELIKNDPRLAPLRSNDDFKKLLTTFEKEKK